MTVQRVGEKAENQRKTKGEIQGTRTSNDLIGFLRQKRDCAIKCAYTLWIRSTTLVLTSNFTGMQCLTYLEMKRHFRLSFLEKARKI
jgi:hypothetical protein